MSIHFPRGLQLLRASILILLLYVPYAFAGGVYTWTDDKGVVHYTDRPIGPEQAKQVKGMEVEANANAPVKPSRVRARALQGTWCAYQQVTTGGAGSVIPERSEWTFNGVLLDYVNLDSQLEIRGRYTLDKGIISSDQPKLGSHPIRSFTGDEMELGTDRLYTRLRRGNC